MRMRSLGSDIRWGVGWGIGFAALYAGFALVQYALTEGQALANKGLSLAAVVGAYAVAGVLGGAVLGVLRPLGRSRGGSILLGFITSRSSSPTASPP
jgi:hypothetical protein